MELLAIPQEEQTNVFNPSVDIGAEPKKGQKENRLFLRFSVKRDPMMVAQWVTFNVIDTERLDWMHGYASARKFVAREGHLRVPFGHREGNYPLGQWISEQRKSYAASQMTGKRVAQLEGLGMIWDAMEFAFEENLAAAKAYFADHRTLAAPRSATALAGIDPDWPLDWQRHYAGVRECVTELGAELVDLEPGVTIHGHDVGRWLERQRQHVVWEGLMPAQRERLTALGVEPHAPAPEEQQPARKASGGRSTAFSRVWRRSPRPGADRLCGGPQGP